MRHLAILIALAGAANGDDKSLEQPPVSSKARQMREQAAALWNGVAATCEKARQGKEVSPAEATEALAAVEQAVDLFERSLREEWHGETNRTLAEAVRAWYRLRALLPPPEPPADDALRKKAERDAEAARLARIRDVREFIMKWGRERRVDSLLRTCPRCEGRKELRSPFDGTRTPCPACLKRGRLIDRDGIIAARWIRFSPLYRQEGRNEQAINRLLRSLGPDEQRDSFAPYISSVSIKEVEDNDVWARVKAQDVVQPSALSTKTEKADVTYVLYRVGKVWYVYDPESDRDVLDLSEKLEPAPPPK